MGSFDSLCGISKLPIHPGDPLVDFLIGEIVPFRDRGFICYSNDLWAPLTIQTYGVYDDYGRVKPDAESGWHMKYVIDAFKQHVVEMPAERHRCLMITPDTITYDLLQDGMHEGRLLIRPAAWVKQDAKTERNMVVTRMSVHRFVFDEIVNWDFSYWSGVIYFGEFNRRRHEVGRNHPWHHERSQSRR